MRAAVIVALLAIGRLAAAAPSASVPIDDQASVLPAADQAVIENDLRQLQGAGVDMAVIMVRRTGTSIESYAHDAAIQWTSTKSEAAGAAVLVIAIDDRKSRIEVNDSLRPRFPDARAQAILDNARGYLRNGDYPGAVRAIIAEVSAAARGVAPDMESPHPQSGLPGTTTPTRTPLASSEPKGSKYGVYGGALGGLTIILLIGALWAAASRKSNFTLSHDGSVNTLQRSFFVDWMWHSAKVLGGAFFILFIILAASGKSSSSTSSAWGSTSSSSTDWSSGSSSSSSSSSDSGGGGWSGGGASSSW